MTISSATWEYCPDMLITWGGTFKLVALAAAIAAVAPHVLSRL
eukprot:CAMPEP_0206253210 /NCGR_PEP_ID=MMETSP0047_2-20121206/23030_1 /ASSEMBLY_ACC=CAM_ASM_000192 /TAXON_ID=195065 /ORGANISM="Chroomonas mesostigmatica_cf, Strain CCMP1168" /LENGTH=42 /DNA_ID= /DNA_START= /DNA_END= /DNA_ORIENTATION=